MRSDEFFEADEEVTDARYQEWRDQLDCKMCCDRRIVQNDSGQRQNVTEREDLACPECYPWMKMTTTDRIELPVDYTKLEWQNKRAVREQYIVEQKGLCYWCETPLNIDPPETITEKEINWVFFPENFLKYPVHLQHCHNTGMTEGAVHAYCNAVMWQYHNR